MLRFCCLRGIALRIASLRARCLRDMLSWGLGSWDAIATATLLTPLPLKRLLLGRPLWHASVNAPHSKNADYERLRRVRFCCVPPSVQALLEVFSLSFHPLTVDCWTFTRMKPLGKRRDFASKSGFLRGSRLRVGRLSTKESWHVPNSSSFSFWGVWKLLKGPKNRIT